MSPFDFLVYYFAVHLPAYIALLLKASIAYRGEALSQHWEWDIITFPVFGLIITRGPAWWSDAFSLSAFSSFLSASLAFSLSLFLED